VVAWLLSVVAVIADLLVVEDSFLWLLLAVAQLLSLLLMVASCCFVGGSGFMFLYCWWLIFVNVGMVVGGFRGSNILFFIICGFLMLLSVAVWLLSLLLMVAPYFLLVTVAS